MDEEQGASFGERLRGLRVRAGLTQEELAERAGLTAKGVGALERGDRRRPYPHTVRALGAALGLSADDVAKLAATVPRRGVHHPIRTPAAMQVVPALPNALVGRGQELDVVPLESTSELYKAIKEDRPPPPPSFHSARQAPSPHETLTLPLAHSVRHVPADPLVGRAAECKALEAVYAQTAMGGRIAVLEGEPGIGKTRLADEFLAHVAAGGARVLATRFYEGEADLAYGPFIELLRAAIWQMDRNGSLMSVPPWALDEVGRLLPELGGRDIAPAKAPLDTPIARTRFFEGICYVLLTPPPRGSTTVLFFDDAQWADQASVDLLAYLARRLRGQPILLLITRRDEQAMDGHGLSRLLAESERSKVLAVLRLSRLGRSSVEELLRLSTPAPKATQTAEAPNSGLPNDLGQRLYDETEGVPLLLREYLTAIMTGAVDASDPRWKVPGGARAMLTTRLNATSDPARHVLTVGATIGRSFDLDTLQAVSDRDEETTVAALEELIARGLIREVPDHRDDGTPIYDFNHEKIRTLVYGEMTIARRQFLHRRIAEALISSKPAFGDSGSLDAQIAHHLVQAGQGRKAAEFFVKAGRYAFALYANVEALAHFRTALKLGHADPSGLHEAIGDVLTLLGEYGAALSSYENAIHDGASSDVPGIERKRADIYQRRGEWEPAESALRTAMAIVGQTGPAAQLAQFHAELSLVVHHQGRTDEAMALAHQALELAEKANDRRALAQTHNVLGLLVTSLGKYDLARDHLEQSLRAAEAVHDSAAHAAALNNLALAYRGGGQLGRALELTNAALALCTTQGDRHREAALHNNLADLLHATGQSAEALSHVKQAVTIYAEIGVEAGLVQPQIWKLTGW